LLFQITGAHLSTYEALYKQVVYLNQYVIALLSVNSSDDYPSEFVMGALLSSQMILN